MKLARFGLLALLIICPAIASASDNSIYQMPVALTDQDNNTFGLDVFNDHPIIISMFYGKCPHVCPLLISTIQLTEKQLTPEQRKNLRVLLVSLDPENDTPAALKAVAAKQNVDTTRWKLTRAEEQDVRKIAAVLGIRYRGLPDGEFNHSTILTLLDRSGAIRAKSSKLAAVDEEFLGIIREEILTQKR